MEVGISEPAERQIEDIDRWWRANRRDAPSLFAEELGGVLDQLATHPHAGLAHAPRPDVRKILMPRTRHHVYFVIRGARVLVICVWSAVRGELPPLER